MLAGKVSKRWLMCAVVSAIFTVAPVSSADVFTDTFETGNDSWVLNNSAVRSDAENHTPGGMWSLGTSNADSVTRDIAGGANESGILNMWFTVPTGALSQSYRILLSSTQGNYLELRNLAWNDGTKYHLVGWNGSAEADYGGVVLSSGWNKITFDVTSDTGWTVMLNDGDTATFNSTGEAQNYFADGASSIYVGDPWGSIGYTNVNYVDDVSWVVPEPATFGLITVLGSAFALRRRSK